MASLKDVSYAAALGDTGTIGSLHFGQMNNDLLLASAGFTSGMDLIKVVPAGQSMFQLIFVA